MRDQGIMLPIGHSEVLRSLLVGRGAPRHLLRGSVRVDERGVLPSMCAAYRPVPPKVQLDRLARAVESPVAGNYLMVIGTHHDEDLAEAVALGLMTRAMAVAAAAPGSVARPYYHAVYGGWKDKLRDDESFRSGIGRIGMLVLVNLADNSTPAKIEAARDLLHMHASTPRIVVVSGADPLAFAVERLRRRPSQVLHLGRSPSRSPKQI